MIWIKSTWTWQAKERKVYQPLHEMKQVTICHFPHPKSRINTKYEAFFLWKCGEYSSLTLLCRLSLFSKIALGLKTHSNWQILKIMLICLYILMLWRKQIPISISFASQHLLLVTDVPKLFNVPIQIENAHLMIPMCVYLWF